MTISDEDLARWKRLALRDGSREWVYDEGTIHLDGHEGIVECEKYYGDLIVEMHTEVPRMVAEVESLRAKLAEAEKALVYIEWAYGAKENVQNARCPDCNMPRAKGHHKKCVVAAALAAISGE